MSAGASPATLLHAALPPHPSAPLTCLPRPLHGPNPYFGSVHLPCTIYHCTLTFIHLDAQVIMLGSGAADYEASFRQAEEE